MEEKFLLGVYDHLRREGEAFPTYMDGAKYLGTYYTDPIFDMFAMSSAYPGLRQEGSTSILLEIFEINRDILKCTDYYQGYNEHNPYMNTFHRVEIDTPFGPCFIYEYAKNIIGKPRIESGDWFKHKRDTKEKMLNLDNESRWGME